VLLQELEERIHYIGGSAVLALLQLIIKTSPDCIEIIALPIGEKKRRQTVDRHVGRNPRAHRLVDAHLQLILPRLQTLDSALGDEHCENAISRAKNSTEKSLTSYAIPVLETDELLQFADDLQSLVHGLLLGRVETQLHFVGDFLHAGINFGVLLAVLTEDLVHRARLLRLLDFFLDDGRVQVGLQAGPQLVLLPLYGVEGLFAAAVLLTFLLNEPIYIFLCWKLTRIEILQTFNVVDLILDAIQSLGQLTNGVTCKYGRYSSINMFIALFS
jgi:hypothetical protein